MSTPPRLRLTMGGQTIEVDPTRTAVLGRDPAADLRSDNRHVSRRHAVVRVEDGQWLIEDAQSARGLWHEGRQVARVVVSGRTEVDLAEPGAGEHLTAEAVAIEPILAPGPALSSRLTEATMPAPPRGPIVLDVVGPDAPANAQLVVNGDTFTIGREPDCDYRIDRDDVSRHHARITIKDRIATVEDLGSRNGTFVNRQRISGPVELADGAAIGVGPVSFIVRLPSDMRAVPAAATPPAATPLTPVATAPGSGMTSVVARLEQELSSVRRGQRSRRPIVLAGVVAVIATVLVVAIIFVALHQPTADEIVTSLEPSIVRVLNPGIGSGTGWAYDAAGGLIVTNNHVMAGGSTWTANFMGESRPLTFVATSQCDDLSVLKMATTTGLRTMPLGSQDGLKRGQTVLAIGYPGTLSQAGDLVATEGIISVPRTSLPGAGNLPDVIQVDAAINPGNSGGPLVDLSGKLIGVNTIKIVRSGFEAQGYAIGVEHVREVVAKLATGTSIGWTGLMFQEGTTATVDGGGALVVSGGSPSTPAADAGLGVAADNEKNNTLWLLTQVGGKPLGTDKPLDDFCTTLLATAATGSSINVTLVPVSLSQTSFTRRGDTKVLDLKFVAAR